MTAFYQTFIRLPLFSLSTLTVMLNCAYAETTTPEKPAVAVLNKVVVPNDEKLFQCTQVNEDLARLACYDKVLAGDTQLNQKLPLDLSKTVNQSLQEKKVIPILANDVRVDVKEVNVEISPTPSTNEATLVTTQIKAVSETVPRLEPTENLDPKQKDKQILAKVGVTNQEIASYSALSNLFDLDRNDPKGVFSLRPHYQTYVLPVFFSKNPNQKPYSPSQPTPTEGNYPDLQHIDSKFQISVKTKMVEDVFNTNADLWFGYTQQSYWQVYNDKESRPFRVSDYQPEVFITQPAKAELPFNGKLRMIGAGLVHQSNGQSNPLSRSWNRAYLMGGVEWGKLSIVPRAWLIFPNFKKHADNADIGEYLGYGDIRWQYPFANKDTIGGIIRYNPFKNKGAIQIDYAHPIRGGMKAYLQLFHGYGENIQNYNHEDTNIGIGLMFNDFTGL